MFDTEQKQDTCWESYSVLIHAQESHWCSYCKYKILPGAWAVKLLGAFFHYPGHPRSRKQNLSLVSERVPNEEKEEASPPCGKTDRVLNLAGEVWWIIRKEY